jgi:hypothetical protein
VELGEKAADFEKRGLKVAALSNDSPAVLLHFARRTGLEIPLLSDQESKTIRAFGILNDNVPPGSPVYGIPFPGTFVIDERGVVKSKYFEEDYAERTTAASILVREFPGNSSGTVQEIETPHLRLRSAATNRAAWAGEKLDLALDVELKPGMHVYAPGVQDSYIPVRWTVAQSKAFLAGEILFPASKTLRLEAIKETVPVYEGSFRLSRHLVIGPAAQLKDAPGAPGRVIVDGEFRYQACDDRMCYPPRNIPLRWTFELKDLDRQRVPPEVRAGKGPAD